MKPRDDRARVENGAREIVRAARRSVPALLLACVVSLAHAETRPRYAGKIEGSLLGAPAVLDPVSARSHAELTVVGFVFDCETPRKT